MVTKAGSRGARSIAMMKDVPKELADKWELLTKLVSEHLYETKGKIRGAIGERPYKGLPVEDTELQKRWSQIAHDQGALVDLLQSNARFKPDGTILVPKELMKTIRELHKKRRAGGYEAF